MLKKIALTALMGSLGVVVSAVTSDVNKDNSGYEKSLNLTYQLPSKEKIAEILEDSGLHYFDEKTKFSQKNAWQKVTGFNLFFALEAAFSDYEKTLQDHPHALNALITLQVFTSSEKGVPSSCSRYLQSLHHRERVKGHSLFLLNQI